MIEITGDALRDALAADGVHIAVSDPETGTLATAYTHNYVTPGPDDPLVNLVISGGSRVLSHITDDAGDAFRPARDAGVRSWVGAPVIVAGRAIGGISVVSRQADRFAGWHRDFLQAAAVQFAVALENARLLDLVSAGKREWESTVDAIGQAFCVLDGNGRIHRANRAFSQLVNIPVTELAGQQWSAVLPLHWSEPLRRALAAGSAAQYEVAADDRVYTATALGLGTESLSVLVFEDQTDKRQLQQQLVQSEKMSAIGQLIAGVAHDLNNPLASVVGFADYLIEETKDVPPTLREPLRAIREEAERAAGIVRNLLSFARRHEGQRRSQPVLPVLQATLQLLNNELTAHRVATSLDIDPDLPLVEIDANQIQQVFVNLLNNATQALATTGEGGRITVRATHWLDGVAVSVEDDGPGIPEGVAEKIFEPFFTTKAEGEGTGLGLSICQGILKEHGGRIVYTPRAGGGAVLRVELPGGKAAGPAPAPVPDETGTLRILVIDDEPHILHYMVATLEAWGHAVTVATDGSEAFAGILDNEYDVILTDLRMPNLGGRELYERLLESHPSIAHRVVFATGDTVRGDVLQFLETAGRPVLHKPFTLTELRTVLAQAAAG